MSVVVSFSAGNTQRQRNRRDWPVEKVRMVFVESQWEVKIAREREMLAARCLSTNRETPGRMS